MDDEKFFFIADLLTGRPEKIFRILNIEETSYNLNEGMGNRIDSIDVEEARMATL